MSFEGVKEKLKSHGVTAETAAKGVGVFLYISFAWIGILWGFCYRFNPSIFMLKKMPFKFVQDAFSKQRNINEHPFLNKLPERIRNKAAVSFFEMLAIKGLVAPVSLPLKIWLTIKFIS